MTSSFVVDAAESTRDR